jgi:hypothetical protein
MVEAVEVRCGDRSRARGTSRFGRSHFGISIIRLGIDLLADTGGGHPFHGVLCYSNFCTAYVAVLSQVVYPPYEKSRFPCLFAQKCSFAV